MTLNFTGAANKSMREGGRHTFGLDNAWTVMAWVKPNDTDGVQTILHMNDTDRGDTDNTIRIDLDGSTVRTLITGPLGYNYPAKFHTYSEVVSAGTWTNLLWTWDGTTPKLYVDGVFMAASGTLTDDGPLTQTDSVDKSIWFAENKDQLNAEYNGRIHSAAVWNSVLPLTTITGVAGDSSKNLFDEGAKHWWKMVITSGNLVVDSGTSADHVDLSSFNVDVTDEVVDEP